MIPRIKLGSSAPAKQLALLGSLLLIFATLTVLPEAHAHVAKNAVIKIAINPRSQQLEVVMRFNLHDLHHAKGQVNHSSKDSSGKPLVSKEDEQLARTLAQAFHLRIGEKSFATPYLGHEIEGKFFWVYLEAAKPESLTNISVQMAAFEKVWPNLDYLVNVELENKKIMSTRFSPSTAWHTVTDN